jgi:hypothetical protein
MYGGRVVVVEPGVSTGVSTRTVLGDGAIVGTPVEIELGASLGPSLGIIESTFVGETVGAYERKKLRKKNTIGLLEKDVSEDNTTTTTNNNNNKEQKHVFLLTFDGKELAGVAGVETGVGACVWSSMTSLPPCLTVGEVVGSSGITTSLLLVGAVVVATEALVGAVVTGTRDVVGATVVGAGAVVGATVIGTRSVVGADGAFGVAVGLEVVGTRAVVGAEVVALLSSGAAVGLLVPATIDVGAAVPLGVAVGAEVPGTSDVGADVVFVVVGEDVAVVLAADGANVGASVASTAADGANVDGAVGVAVAGASVAGACVGSSVAFSMS